MERSEDLLLELILNSIYNGIVAINAKGIIRYFNKTAERIFTIAANEALDRYILDVLPNTGGKLLECLQTGTPFYGQKLKGETVTLISNVNPLVMNGKISGVVSVFQDISEIETISKELDLYKNTKNWLDAVIDSSYDGLWICDHNGKVIRINRASERIIDRSAEEVIGRDVKALVAEGLIDKSVTLEVLEKKSAVTIIQEIEGGKKVLVTGNPIIREDGEISFVVVNDRDITELDHLRTQLHEAQVLAKGYISKLSEMEMSGVDLSSIVFRSIAMERIIEMALKVAKVDSSILIFGESGVGKGMLAKLIHKHSERSKGPFIRVDCAGIPDSLIESELFGYEKGAFTGAKAEGKPGLFELANKGTLFLDEVGEIPFSSQSKLLRFLEDHEVVRVGGGQARQIDVRIIAATNKNLDEMVTTKQFRKDLYYRINVVPITIPALRERRDDILPLVFYFLKRFKDLYRQTKVFSPEVLDVLYKYDYPGNIRELANLVERCVVTVQGDRIDKGDLPGNLVTADHGALPSSLISESLPLKEAVERFERLFIEAAVRRCGSQRKAATILNVDHGTISRKMRRSGSRNGSIVHRHVYPSTDV